MNLSIKSWIAIAAVALVQTAALGYMVYERVTLLRYGREVVAQVVPLDPRDIFRGDYVVLGYSFSSTGEVNVPEGTKTGDTVYVTLKPTANDEWEIVGTSATYAAASDPTQVVFQAIANYVSTPPADQPDQKPHASLRYGIEQYFVPEGTGKSLEDAVRDKKIAAVLAVGATGKVAIKGLIVDGKRVSEQPWL
jgi:uncharacterized membrane-anchored protein